MGDQTSTPTIILLVEDQAVLRLFVADLLRSKGGFTVIEAANADEALTLLEASGDTVRALVTDVEMPGSMDGFTLTRLAHKAWPHMGLVVVSGRAKPQADDVPEGTVFLSKPFRAKALIKAVHSVLGHEPNASTEPVLPPIPAALKIDLPYIGIGSVAGHE